jgi:hypothetical protein
MKQVIRFYVPLHYIPKQRGWVAPELRGKVLQFRTKRSA